jgi:hypothetical protein
MSPESVYNNSDCKVPPVELLSLAFQDAHKCIWGLHFAFIWRTDTCLYNDIAPYRHGHFTADVHVVILTAVMLKGELPYAYCGCAPRLERFHNLDEVSPKRRWNYTILHHKVQSICINGEWSPVMQRCEHNSESTNFSQNSVILQSILSADNHSFMRFLSKQFSQAVTLKKQRFSSEMKTRNTNINFI